MKSFLQQTEHRVNRDFANAAAKILEAMGLPNPDKGEFVNGYESDLLFLSDYGLVLRAGLKMQSPEHDRILAPLRASKAFEKDGFKFVIELMPGIRSGVNDYLERKDLKLLLELDNILFWDDAIENCGYLPLATPAHPKGIPVVLDRGGVKQEGGPALKMDFNEAAEPVEQKKIYAKLHDALETAWPEGAKLPQGDLGNFLQVCKADLAAPDGILCSEWESPEHAMGFRDPYNPDKTTLAAFSGGLYAQRLRGLKNG